MFNKQNFKDVIDGKAVINIQSEVQEKIFFRELKKYNFSFKESIRKFVDSHYSWDTYKEETCIRVCYGESLRYGSLNCYRYNYIMPILNFNDVISSECDNCYQYNTCNKERCSK